MSAPDWPGTSGFPALPYRTGFARQSVQLPFASGNSETDAPEVLWGTGSPEGAVTGAPGDLYVQTDGTAGRTVWQKESGTGNTGWVALRSRSDVLWVDDYGATGTADDLPVINAALAAQTAGQIVKFTPGKTYNIGSPVGLSGLPKVAVSGTIDLTGVTLHYVGASLSNGADGGGVGILNILADNVNVIGFGRLDTSAAQVTYPIAIKAQVSGCRLFVELANLREPGVWAGISYQCSSDVTGVPIAGAVAKNVMGFLVRPNCPIIDSTDTITTHADLTALFVAADAAYAGTGGGAIVFSSGAFGAMLIRTDKSGVPLFVFTDDSNNHFLDLSLNDLGCVVQEINGLQPAAAYGLAGTDRLGTAYKNGAAVLMSHANLGTDASTPSCVMIARAQGQAEIDFDYSATAGGRLIGKLISPAEAVLVSGVDARTGNVVEVTLTAARVVGAPLNPRKGQRIVWKFIQDGTGGHAVTWDAVFKLTWSDAGNTLGLRSSIATIYNGTTWDQDGAQAPYV